MTKLVYNDCYGGFSISKAAVLRAREISGDPKWGDAVLIGETYPDGLVNTFGLNMYYIHEIDRHNPVLVQIVEELGNAASGARAELKIYELSEGTLYRIDECDGRESVMTVEDYDWKIA